MRSGITHSNFTKSKPTASANLRVITNSRASYYRSQRSSGGTWCNGFSFFDTILFPAVSSGRLVEPRFHKSLPVFVKVAIRYHIISLPHVWLEEHNYPKSEIKRKIILHDSSTVISVFKKTFCKDYNSNLNYDFHRFRIIFTKHEPVDSRHHGKKIVETCHCHCQLSLSRNTPLVCGHKSIKMVGYTSRSSI